MTAMWGITSRQSSSEADTARLAHDFAEILVAGAWVGLIGPLGAGKSVFARAIGRTLGVSADMPSPTYTLMAFIRDGFPSITWTSIVLLPRVRPISRVWRSTSRAMVFVWSNGPTGRGQFGRRRDGPSQLRLLASRNAESRSHVLVSRVKRESAGIRCDGNRCHGRSGRGRQAGRSAGCAGGEIAWNVLESAIDTVLSRAGWSRRDVQGLTLVTGPGSLTATRIGWATAAGWAQAASIPVTGWPTPFVHHRYWREWSRSARFDPRKRTYCLAHYRGDVFYCYEFEPEHPPGAPIPVTLGNWNPSDPTGVRIVGPGVIGHEYRERCAQP